MDLKKKINRLFFASASAAVLLLPIPLFASVLVNPVGPYVMNTIGSSQTVYYAGEHGAVLGTALSTGGHVDTPQGFAIINTAESGATVLIDVSSDKDFSVSEGQVIVVTLSASTDAGTEIPLIGAGTPSGFDAPSACSGTTCQASNYSARYTEKSVLRLQFRLADLCAVSVASGGSLCDEGTGTVNDPAGSTFSETVRVTFSVTDEVSLGSVSSSEESTAFTLGISSISPTFDSSVCAGLSEEQYYFPGDGELILFTAPYSVSKNGGLALTNYLVLLKKSGTPSDLYTGFGDADTVARFDVNVGEAKIEGMDNTTDGSDNAYTGKIYVANKVGITSATYCTLSNMRAQPINGVLNSSKCYIATATFHSGKAWPVRLLRQFRDQVLDSFALGKKLVQMYYEFSEKRSEKLWDSWWMRRFSLRWLMRLQPWVWLSNQVVSAVRAEGAEVVESQGTGMQTPYIDRLKGRLGNEDPVGSYIENLQKELAPNSPPPSDGYTEKLKSKLPESESSEDYSKKILSGLNPDTRPSVVQTVKDGTYEPGDPYEGHEIKHGAGFRMGVSPGSNVVANGSTYSFADIYGDNWRPEVLLHYEYQTFHSEWVGSLGLTADLGFQYDGGFGQLTYPFGSNGTKSRTRFSFIQVPFLLGANYRFNLFRILRPYAGASAGVMGYSEIRSDSKPDYRGYSFLYSFNAGVSVLLDFLDPKTMRDAFLSSGIRHVYLQAEYFNLGTLMGDVTFSRGGIYAGFLFEF